VIDSGDGLALIAASLLGLFNRAIFGAFMIRIP